MNNNDKSWKIVKQDQNNSDQYLLGYFNSEKHAKDNVYYLMQKYGNWIRSRDELIIKRVDPQMIINPVCTDYMHYVWSLIPKEETYRVMRSDASAEIDANNLMCGGSTYYYLSRLIDKNWTVIDIGCSYNAQSYLFQNHKKYIAIEPVWKDSHFKFEYFKAPKTEILFMTGQKFISEVLPTLNLNLDRTFAIVNYVPNDSCSQLVRETFKNVWAYYPA